MHLDDYKVAKSKVDSAWTAVVCNVILGADDKQSDQRNFVLHSLGRCQRQCTVVFDYQKLFQGQSSMADNRNVLLRSAILIQ